MIPPPVWIIGRKGLLGSALARAVVGAAPSASLWDSPIDRFAWTDPLRMAGQFAVAAGAFADRVREAGGRWMVMWAAGAGVVGTAPAALRAEVENLRLLLEAMEKAGPARRPDASGAPGTVFLASSAGGVYGGTAEQPATEASPVRPVSDYGRSKLLMEEMLAAWCRAAGVSHLIGRISNLYGPGQNLAKPQGLISHLLRCRILNTPATVFVPMDTIRDYHFADDCAGHICRTALHLAGAAAAAGRPAAATKIFASEQPASIAHIVGIVAKIGRRPARIVCAPGPAARQQPRTLAFRSVELLEPAAPRRTDLRAGIHRTYQHLLSNHLRGGAPAAG